MDPRPREKGRAPFLVSNEKFYKKFDISLAIPFLRFRVPRLGRGFDAEAKVERNGMISGEQNLCLGFRGA